MIYAYYLFLQPKSNIFWWISNGKNTRKICFGSFSLKNTVAPKQGKNLTGERFSPRRAKEACKGSKIIHAWFIVEDSGVWERHLLMFLTINASYWPRIRNSFSKNVEDIMLLCRFQWFWVISIARAGNANFFYSHIVKMSFTPIFLYSFRSKKASSIVKGAKPR